MSVLLQGCSGDAIDESGNLRWEDVGELQNAIVFPAQVTPDTATAFRSETELGFAQHEGDTIQIVAYNDLPHPDASTNNAIGWSFSRNGEAWQLRKVDPPAGHVGLRGDPAVAVSGDPRFVLMSSLGVPNGAPANHGDACVFLSSNGGQSFSPFHCVTPPPSPEPIPPDFRNFYDGGSLASFSTPSGQISFAAYNNVRGSGLTLDSRIHLFWSTPNTPLGSFVRTTGTWDPFRSVAHLTHPGHPKLAADQETGIVAVVWPVLNGLNIQLKYHVAATFGGFLGNPATVADGMPPSGTFPIGETEIGDFITLGNGTRIRQGPEFDVAVGRNESNQPEARVVYVKRVLDPDLVPRLHVFGARCPITPDAQGNLTCTNVPQWSTDAAHLPLKHEEFAPRIAYAEGKWAVSYYTTFSLVPDDSHVHVAGQSFYGDGTAGHDYRSKIGPVAMSITPCPLTAKAYWTDYDDIKYNPTEDRFVTTYAGSGCPARVFEGQLPADLWSF